VAGGTQRSGRTQGRFGRRGAGGASTAQSRGAGGRARGGGTKVEVNFDSLNDNELKGILKSRGIVDFGDCFEKSDLIAKIKTLGNYANVDVAGGGVDVSAAGWAETPGADSKRKAVYDTLFCPRELKSANLCSRGMEKGQERREIAASGQIITRRKSSSTCMCCTCGSGARWTYLALDKDQNIKIETCFRQGNLVARLADMSCLCFRARRASTLSNFMT